MRRIVVIAAGTLAVWRLGVRVRKLILIFRIKWIVGQLIRALEKSYPEILIQELQSQLDQQLWSLSREYAPMIRELQRARQLSHTSLFSAPSDTAVN